MKRLIVAQHYRNEATSMRELASKADDPKTQKRLLQLAELYDQLSHKVRHERGEAAPNALAS